MAESTGRLVQSSGPSDEILDGGRGEEAPIRIQGINSEIIWTPDDAAFTQRLDHFSIATATDIGVARYSSDRLLALIVSAAEQEIGNALFGHDMRHVIPIDHHRCKVEA